MTTTIPVKAIELLPGSTINIHNISWQDFEEILAELGESPRSRATYYGGKLEIMSPLALHERPHRIIADIVKTILDRQGRDWEDFGSTTLKRPPVAGVEPDTGLYIQNTQQVRGCTNLDLDIDPPPDLAIESDVTSKTVLDAYTAIGVPEVLIYSKQRLKIYLFAGNEYRETATSSIFPDIPIITLIPELVVEAIETGTSKMLRELRKRNDF
ncbi:MAG: Uma2 family endonuclease [Cyanobacteriota bacterium]|nr:Uma2 family endonuclease [Cyanobacteriota bacterium]